MSDRTLTGRQWWLLRITARLPGKILHCSSCYRVLWGVSGLEVVIVAGFILLAWRFSSGYVTFCYWLNSLHPERLRNLALGFAGMVALPFGIWRICISDQTNQLTRERLSQDRDGAERELRATRYSDAIELLGHTDFAVRVGAVFDLADLAKKKDTTYEDNTHEAAVVETFTAWLRQHCRESPNDRPEYLSIASAIVATLNELYSETGPRRGSPLNLRGVDLSPWARFGKMTLLGAELQGANLSKLDLSGCDLSAANLIRAKLHGANLSKVKWVSLVADWAELDGACLQGANFLQDRSSLQGKTSFRNASFVEADLTGTRFDRGSKLQEAKFPDATCIRTKFIGCCLRAADFSGCKTIAGADFADAIFEGDWHFDNVDITRARHLPPEIAKNAG